MSSKDKIVYREVRQGRLIELNQEEFDKVKEYVRTLLIWQYELDQKTEKLRRQRIYFIRSLWVEMISRCRDRRKEILKELIQIRRIAREHNFVLSRPRKFKSAKGCDVQ